MKTLDQCKWKAFKIGDILTIEPCKCSKVCEIKDGSVPYVGATNQNNGVLRFIAPPSSMITKGNCIAFICDGDGSIGYSIYRQSDFVGSTTVKVGRCSDINKYTGMFITTIADLVRPKYSFGYKRNERNLKREKIMLPVTAKDEPDWAFMEEYMKAKEHQLLTQYQKYIAQIIDNQQITPPINNKQWRAFRIIDLFTYKKGNQNNMSQLTSGTTPLISAKKVDNGYKAFVSSKKPLFCGHCISLNCDGDGGAGIAYYQPVEMALDTHVMVLYPQESLSKSQMLFIAYAITSQRDSFGHGHSINENRLATMRVMLPTTPKGAPDYEYMANYMRNLESKLLQQYVNSKLLTISA